MCAAHDTDSRPRPLALDAGQAWSTEPIDDEYGGTTTPLTASVARRGLAASWAGTARVLGAAPRVQVRAAQLGSGALGWRGDVAWFDVAANPTFAGRLPPDHARRTDTRPPACTKPLATGAATAIRRPRRLSRWIDRAIRLTLIPHVPDDDQYRCMLRRVGRPPHHRPPGVR
jgi:hypothetical protein